MSARAATHQQLRLPGIAPHDDQRRGVAGPNQPLALDDAADGDLLEGRTAWLFGNEAWGLPVELADLADQRVRIPIHGRAESLNLATAAAVCLYASARAQRAG